MQLKSSFRYELSNVLHTGITKNFNEDNLLVIKYLESRIKQLEEQYE